MSITGLNDQGLRCMPYVSMRILRVAWNKISSFVSLFLTGCSTENLNYE